MALLATGTGPDQIPNTGRLGGAAFVDMAEFYASFAASATLDQLRGSIGSPVKIVFLTDSGLQGFFFRDDADTTTPDDNKDVILTSDPVPVRFKRRQVLRTYTPTSGADTTMVTGSLAYDANGIWMKTDASTVMIAQFVRSGATASRPTGLTALHTGLQYYDITLGKPVWYTGTGTTWKDATGTTV